MGNLRASLSVALFALIAPAACGNDSASTPVDALTIVDAADPDAAIDAPPPPDAAPVYDFSCVSNAAPTTAPATITLAGTVQEVYLDLSTFQPGIRNTQGANLTACVANCSGQDNLGSAGPTPANGTFTTPGLDTGGTPLDGYLKVTKSGNQATWIYPAYPLSTNLAGIPALMMASLIYNNLGQAGVTQTAGNGIVAAFLTDCANTPVTGATVTVTRNGQMVGAAVQDASTFGSQAAGGYLAFDVPPEAANDAPATVISATYDGTTFLTRTVRTVADTLSIAQVKPGYAN